MTEHDETSWPYEINNDALYSQICTLVHRCLSSEAQPAEVDELERLICDDPQARRIYVALMHETRSLRRWATTDARESDPTPTRSVSEESSPHASREERITLQRDGYYGRRHVSYVAAAVVLVAIGIGAFALWPRQPAQPVAVKAVVDSAATLVSATDAQWLGQFRPQNDSIAPGQRLVLEHGSAEITFSRQARVILQSPADMVIVDGGACRLASGKLTAYVPAPAKGFQVHTPDGTVTDLGTEFGVYVKAGPEIPESNEQQEQTEIAGPQPDKEPPITEVHVFKGKVELAQAQTDPKAKILSAGQAVTISENKVEPLPAADPFKFALDKLQGKPRKVLLSEDFEAYDIGPHNTAIGPWIVQGGTFRKGQGVAVIDPAATIAQLLADPTISIPHASPGPANGQRVAKCVSSLDFPKDTYPLLVREVDCRQFARHCQVLVEFDLFAQGDWTEPSLAFAAKVGQGPGIALWQTSDAMAPKIEWQPHRWYRVRVLLDVADGAVRSVRGERSLWAGAEGWVRDSAFTPPIPQVEWKTPPRYVIFGFPVPPTGKSGGHYWLDNIRVEAIGETTKSLGAGTEKTFDNP